MPAPTIDDRTLHTESGDVRLDEFRLRIGGREWNVMHTGSVLSFEEEQHFLSEERARVPYGVVLWPAAIALAHELAARGGALGGRRVLEIGAGTGLPGIVAATFGASVVQSDRQERALEVCRRNGARNGASSVEYRLADWTVWEDDERYEIILGADVLYAEAMQPHLRRIFDANLAPGGRLLLADPFRKLSLALLEEMERDGWSVTLAKWTVDAGGGSPRAIGVFDVTR